eukprot:CAMPEP_0181355426 /NCGR_PEP_ID=MMETSP1106-20121128/3892_1 /TAXON_ID=81844 /ORGANISM="Mantoniella antarctica, Strain SL-175" /LENGTH=1101 /DNA_ID=CAMNT_0023468163 /DNA_START=126 /DNA_END=3432 /DNA_ORIENTATION=-
MDSEDAKVMREFVLTPTLARDDPLGIPSPPRKKLKRSTAAAQRRINFGFSGNKHANKGAPRDTEAAEGGASESRGVGEDAGDEDEDDEEYTTLHESFFQSFKEGDPVVVILLAVVVYLVFHRAAEHLPPLAACLVTLYGSRMYYKGRLETAARQLRAEHVSSLAWTPISPLETANWLNWTITSLWAEILRPRFTDDVKLAIARQLLTTKLPWFIASAAVKKVNLGNEPPKIGNLQVLRNRYGRQVCEADIAFNAKDMGITVRLTLRTANSVVKFITGRSMMGSIDIQVRNLVLEGRIRYFPLLGHPIIITSFMQTPKVRFDVNVSGVSMTAVPQMKRFMGRVMSEALGRKLIFPYGFGVELGKKTNVKPPENGIIEFKFKWIELWKGFNTEKVKVTSSSSSNSRSGMFRTMIGVGKSTKKGGVRCRSAIRRKSLDVSGAPAGAERGEGEEREASEDDHSEEDECCDEMELQDTVLEAFAGASKPPPIPVTNRGERTDAGVTRHPGMPEVVEILEGRDKEAVIRFPITAGTSRVQLTLRHGGYGVHGVIMYKWCTRTCLTHVWHAAPIPDQKTDSMRLSNAENGVLVLGLHTQNGSFHPIVGACEVNVKFRWGNYKKLDVTSASAGPSKPLPRSGSASPRDIEGGAPVPTSGSLSTGSIGRVSCGVGARSSWGGEGQAETHSSPAMSSTLGAMQDGVAALQGQMLHGGLDSDMAGVTGILQVDVVQAKDLPARDSNGASDPYIIVCVNNQKAKTAVRAATLTPVWEHRMIFRLGCDAEQEKLILKVFDHDSLSWSDDFLGTAEVGLGEFLDGELHNKWVKLTAIESGEVRLRIHYFPGVTCAPRDGWDVEERIDAEQAKELETASWALAGAHDVAHILASSVVAQGGVLVVTLKTGENLIKADVLTGSSDPYCALRCGSDRHKSAIKYRTLNPSWNQSFEFSISPIQRVSGRILIECLDHDVLSDDDFLGNATVELSEVPDDGTTAAMSLDLEGVSHGIVNVEVRFVPVGPALDVMELAARSAATQRLSLHGVNSASNRLTKTLSGRDAEGLGGSPRHRGRSPGGCFGGCFTPPKTTTSLESHGSRFHGGKLTTTEGNSDYA